MVVASTGISPQLPAPHGITGWHAGSPGKASCPRVHDSGKDARHPMAPSASKPALHSSGGTPAGWHVPSLPSVPAGQPSSCTPGATHASPTVRLGGGHASGVVASVSGSLLHAAEPSTTTKASESTRMVDPTTY